MSTPLDPVDAAWLRMETPTNPMTILVVLWTASPVSVEVVRARLAALVARFPRFRQAVVERRTGPAWEDDPAFSVEAHLHHVALPAPADRAALAALAGDLGAAPLDLRFAPWQAHLVDGYDGGSALVVRVHHCVADGVSLARALLTLIDEPPEPASLMPTGLRDGGHVRSLWTGLRAAIDAERLLALPADPDTSLRGAVTTPIKRCGWTAPIALAEVKAVGRALGATVNDVLAACVASALGAHLREAGQDVPQVRAFVPVNLRPVGDVELGNRFSMVLLPLPVGERDPVEAVRAVHAEMSRIRGGAEPAVVWGLLSVAGQVPRAAEALIVDLMDRKGSLVLTHVRGPEAVVHLGGARVGGVAVWVPQSGRVGLGVSLFSYAGGVVVGVAADASRVADPQGVADGVAAAFGALQAAVRRIGGGHLAP